MYEVRSNLGSSILVSVSEDCTGEGGITIDNNVVDRLPCAFRHVGGRRYRVRRHSEYAIALSTITAGLVVLD